ncbi:MAG: TatD family hydrolase [Yersiniaceae bacterium]|uniref:Metal-dependent hydrolase n=1 Tax=Chimaeribacter coloradensis TaxID=2060068 RepID=A0A2N5E953_9GAMM|nr:TatD family hydrolase [Chimaeribacter coloradensis]MDU6410386.1 TatD family hydrolase [Yersiniaceae bacterium]PLR38421.1 metal-dependent hydrolase [Chimaeribacter coloradensis]
MSAPHYFIDTHCHFDFPPFVGEAAASVARAADHQVRQIIVPAVTADRFDGVLALADRHDALFAALGLHPLFITQHDDAALARLAAHLKQPPATLVAVGEIGLDLYMDNPHFERQKALLEDQLHLAKQANLPVILHSRRTHDQLFSLLRKQALPATGVVHGFAGSLAQAQAFVKLGYAIGVGGTITYERAQKTRKTIAALPLSCLLLETDAPDMPLAGYQGQPNRPERAAQVFEVLCQLRPEPPETIAAALNANTRRVFNLPLLSA